MIMAIETLMSLQVILTKYDYIQEIIPTGTLFIFNYISLVNKFMSKNINSQ